MTEENKTKKKEQEKTLKMRKDYVVGGKLVKKGEDFPSKDKTAIDFFKSKNVI